MSIVNLCGGVSASCYVSFQNMVKQGCQVLAKPKKGAIAYFNWAGNAGFPTYDHVGICESDGNYTIEGNTSDAVMRRERKAGLGYAIKYIMPKYESDAQRDAVIAMAASQIGTKEVPYNRVKYNTWFYGNDISSTQRPWCQAFVAWVFDQITGSTASEGGSSSSPGSSSGSNSGTAAGGDGLLAVDGLWGTATTKRAQKILGTGSDGIVSQQYSAYRSANPGCLSSTFDWRGNPTGGSPLIKAIQKKIGTTQDGFVGPSTFKALQKYLGTGQDGVISYPSDCVKALQKRLNTGKF